MKERERIARINKLRAAVSVHDPESSRQKSRTQGNPDSNNFHTNHQSFTNQLRTGRHCWLLVQNVVKWCPSYDIIPHAASPRSDVTAGSR
ncbi:hypothetical protein GN956_G19072 [Arapaima gigas]